MRLVCKCSHPDSLLAQWDSACDLWQDQKNIQCVLLIMRHFTAPEGHLEYNGLVSGIPGHVIIHQYLLLWLLCMCRTLWEWIMQKQRKQPWIWLILLMDGWCPEKGVCMLLFFFCLSVVLRASKKCAQVVKLHKFIGLGSTFVWELLVIVPAPIPAFCASHQLRDVFPVWNVQYPLSALQQAVTLWSPRTLKSVGVFRRSRLAIRMGVHHLEGGVQPRGHFTGLYSYLFVLPGKSKIWKGQNIMPIMLCIFTLMSLKSCTKVSVLYLLRLSAFFLHVPVPLHTSSGFSSAGSPPCFLCPGLSLLWFPVSISLRRLR